MYINTIISMILIISYIICLHVLIVYINFFFKFFFFFNTFCFCGKKKKKKKKKKSRHQLLFIELLKYMYTVYQPSKYISTLIIYKVSIWSMFKDWLNNVNGNYMEIHVCNKTKTLTV